MLVLLIWALHSSIKVSLIITYLFFSLFHYFRLFPSLSWVSLLQVYVFTLLFSAFHQCFHLLSPFLFSFLLVLNISHFLQLLLYPVSFSVSSFSSTFFCFSFFQVLLYFRFCFSLASKIFSFLHLFWIIYFFFFYFAQFSSPVWITLFQSPLLIAI